MSNMRMHSLSLASAAHLLGQGHITPQHHAKIVHAVKAKKMQFARSAAPKIKGFGSLAQQAQAPIPAVGMGPSTIPAGTSSGYDEQ